MYISSSHKWRTDSLINRTPIFATLLLVLAAAPAACLAQQGALHEKMKDLNVRMQTDHYVLAGTVTNDRFQVYGDALEYIYREYEKGFSEVLKDEEKEARKAGKATTKKPKRRGGAKSGKKDAEESLGTLDQVNLEEKFPVIVFNNRQQYLDFGQAFLGSSEHTIGMYVHSEKLLLILDQGNFDDTCEVLFHEAFHQFMDKHVKNPPMWLNEGLATHYGYAKPTRNGLSFSRPPVNRWQLTRKLISNGHALPLWSVVSASRREFYDKTPVHVSGWEGVTRQSLYYGHAYTLVHTLLYDKTGRERLRDYLRALARDDGRGTVQITQEYFGPEVCEHMTPFWIKHVNSRPENK